MHCLNRENWNRKWDMEIRIAYYVLLEMLLDHQFSHTHR
jgi:hypothetical protein